MSWMKKFSLARYNAKSPFNDRPAGKGPHAHPHAQGVETTDNPEGEVLSDKVYGEKQVTIGNWEDIDGKQQRTITTTQDYTQTGTTPGKTFKDVGVSAQEGRAYWEANPEKYQEYLKSKQRQLKGQDVSKRIETRDLPTPPPKKPEDPIFKPYKIQMTRGFANSDTARKGIGHPQFEQFVIDTPEKEASFKKRIKNYEKMQDQRYRQLDPDHFGSTEKALNLAIQKNKDREIQRDRVKSQVIRLDTGQAYNPTTGIFEDVKNKDERFAMNYGTPMKNLNTEGTFKNKDTKKYKSYE